MGILTLHFVPRGTVADIYIYTLRGATATDKQTDEPITNTKLNFRG